MAKALKPIKEPKLTIKEVKFLKLYLKTGNATRSIMAVYDCKYKSARSMGSQLLTKLNVSVRDLLEEHNLTFVDSIKAVKDAYKAEKIITSPTEPDYKTPDHLTRLKAVQIVDRWLGIESKPEEGRVSRRVVAEEFFND